MSRGTGLLGAPAFAALAVALLGGACGRPSDEARVRALLERTAARVEARDVGGLAGSFTEEYVDFEGRDRDGTVRLVTDYLARTRGLVVHVLGVRVGQAGPDGRIEAGCEVALSHGAAEALRKLVRVGGEYYRFSLELLKDPAGEWRFAYAEWEPLDLAGLFPESLDVLRKLFPRL